MKKDDLGNRMKDYEMRTRTYLPRRSNIIIRIDGKAFHSYTKGLNKPFDLGLMEDMAETTKYLCSKIQGAKFGYTQSDEISILITDYDTIKTHVWFGGQIQKIVSVAASMATSKFNYLRLNRKFNLGTDCVDIIMDMFKLAEFDARVYTLPDKEEVLNYFIWRQQDASRNSVSMLAQSNFSHKQLQNKNTSQMQDMLMTEKGINWNNLQSVEKRGWGVLRRKQKWIRPKDNKSFKPFKISNDDCDVKDNEILYERNAWVVDNNIPIFTKDREYILDTLPIKNEIWKL